MSEESNTSVTKEILSIFCGPKDEGIVLILIRTVMAVDMTSVTVEGKK